MTNAEMNQSLRINDRVINSRDVSSYSYNKGKLTVRSKGVTHYAYHEDAYSIKERLDNEFKFREYLSSMPF